MKIQSVVFACAAALALSNAACGNEPGAANVVSTSSPLVEGLTGTYDFVLEASDVGAVHRSRCVAEGAGDSARAERCFDAIKRDASQEKIRFSRGESGELVWTSFAVEDDREVVFVEVAVAISETERGGLVAKSAGWPRGTLAGRITHLRSEIRIERENDGVLVMVDPKKGRLAYRRSG